MWGVTNSIFGWFRVGSGLVQLLRFLLPCFPVQLFILNGGGTILWLSKGLTQKIESLGFVFGWFFVTFYYGKSPSNPPFWEYFSQPPETSKSMIWNLEGKFLFYSACNPEGPKTVKKKGCLEKTIVLSSRDLFHQLFQQTIILKGNTLDLRVHLGPRCMKPCIPG